MIDELQNPPQPPFTKGGSKKRLAPFRKRGSLRRGNIGWALPTAKESKTTEST
jgi:hypothetical protein